MGGMCNSLFVMGGKCVIALFVMGGKCVIVVRNGW